MPNDQLDLNAVRLAHLRWELGLETLLQGDGGCEPLKGHEDCDLGLWIYGSGLRRYGKLNSIWQLKSAHQRFHKAAEDTMSAFGAGRKEEAVAAMAQVRRLSGEILFLLTSLELDVLESQAEGPARERGWGLLLYFFGRPPSRDLYSMMVRGQNSTTLNVNGARLAHLRWIRDLQRAFRGHGQTTLPPSEECDLGVWIHGTAFKKIGRTEELLRLDVVHKQFHNAMSRVLSALKKRQYKVADEVYEDALAHSAEIVSLLTRLQFIHENSGILTSCGGATL